MLELLLFLFSGVGITNIIVNASILDYPRDFIIKHSLFFGKLVSCMLCTGFWVGLILSLFSSNIFGIFGIIAPICAGGTISLFSVIYDIITDYFLFTEEGVDEA